MSHKHFTVPPEQWEQEQVKRRTSLKYEARLKEAIADCQKRYPNAIVLDVGFGDAEYLQHWSKDNVVGIDVNLEVVNEAKGKAQYMDGHRMSFSDDEFDVVFSSHTFEHSYAPRQLAREFERVATKAIYLIVPVQKDDEDPAHFTKFVTPQQVASYFAWPCIFMQRRVHGDFCFIFEPNT